MYGRRLVRFEHFEASKFLVDYRQRLEPFGFSHLLVKPRLDFIVLYLWKFLVHVVNMPVQLEKCDLRSARISPPTHVWKCKIGRNSERGEEADALTISSSQIGQNSRPFWRCDGAAKLILAARSWLTSGSGLSVERGEVPVAGCEFRDGLLPSEGPKGLGDLKDRTVWPLSVGCAMPLPLPRILPPPSFRDAIGECL